MTSNPNEIATPVTPETCRLLDSLPRAIMVRSLQGDVLAWNAVAERLMGRTAAEVIGRPVPGAVMWPVDLELATCILERCEAGEPWTGELSVERHDGETIRLNVHVAPVRDADGEIVATVSAAEDVTHLRVAEARVADIADHLQLALEAGGLGTWDWDMATGNTHWDPTMCVLFGRDPRASDVEFAQWVEMLHPDDVEHTLSVVNEALADPGPYQMEHRVVWPDGTERWVLCRGRVRVDGDGTPIGTIGCAADITAQKEVHIERDRRMFDAEQNLRNELLARERLEFLARINEVALNTPDPVELMSTITNAAVPRLGDWCTLHFVGEPGTAPIVHAAHVDPDKAAWVEDLQAKYPYDPDASTGVAVAIRTGETELVQIDETFIDEAIKATTVMTHDEARRVADELQLTSIITVPLRTSRGVVGAMQFVSAETGRVYNQDDVSLAEAAAGRVAAALDNAWLNHQYRGVASSLQRALLPVAVPDIDGLDIAVRYWAAGIINEVGGEFYDIFPLGHDRWAIVIGDVCGRGPEAAAVTAKARHTIRAAATHGMEHAAVLDWVNEAILASGRGRFCTVAYATLERDGQECWLLTTASAGHPLPVVVERNGTHLAGRPGTLAGVLPELSVTVTTTRLEPGDTIVLYTDGLTDVPAPHNIDDITMQSIVAHASTGLTAECVAESLRQTFDGILSFERRNDDMALVVLRAV